MDGVELGRRNRKPKDPPDLAVRNQHLAKVRVAGSNPVFRSKVAGQRQFSKPERRRPKTSLASRCVELASVRVHERRASIA
jgi:hypothetical protein